MKEIREFKGKSLTHFVDEYIVIDIETTGLMPQWDEIIEIGALHIKDNKIIREYQQLIKPEYKVDDFITDLTGITNEMLLNKPQFNEITNTFMEFIKDHTLVGHNVNFDINFLYDNLRHNNIKLENNFIDLLRFSRRINKDLENHKLSTIASYYEIETLGNHRALKDCHITFACLKALQEYMINENLTTDEIFKKVNSNYKFDISSITTNNMEFDETHILYGRTCVFTGKLDKMPRKDAMQLVVDLGGLIGNNVTKKTNYLILGNNDYCASIKDGKSSKQKKAENLIINGQDLMIIPESVFYDLVL